MFWSEFAVSVGHAVANTADKKESGNPAVSALQKICKSYLFTPGFAGYSVVEACNDVACRLQFT